MQGEDLALTGDLTAQNIGARSIISLRAVALVNVTVDPTIVPGVPAPIGSLALLSGTGIWQKTGALDTAWTAIGGGGGTVGPGTTNTIAKFTGATAVGDSQITDDGSAVAVTAGTTIDLNAGSVLTLQSVGFLILTTQDILNMSALDGVSLIAVNPGANIGISTIEGNIELHSAVTGGPGNLVLSADNGDASLLANGTNGNITVSGAGQVNVTTPQTASVNGTSGVTISAGGGPVDINGAGPIVIDAVAPTIISNATAHPVGFYGTAGVAQQVGVPVTAAGIHAALVALGLIAP